MYLQVIEAPFTHLLFKRAKWLHWGLWNGCLVVWLGSVIPSPGATLFLCVQLGGVVWVFWGGFCFSKAAFYFRRRQWHPTPVLLPGKSHGPRSLVGCSPWVREELDTTEQLPFDFSLSCIGEGNGNPLQCSCLENPRDRGAWCAAVYGVAQSWHDWSDLASKQK